MIRRRIKAGIRTHKEAFLAWISSQVPSKMNSMISSNKNSISITSLSFGIIIAKVDRKYRKKFLKCLNVEFFAWN